MDIPHLLILELTVLGAVVTLYGLVAAVIGAAGQVTEENRRIAIAERLHTWELAEMNARPKEQVTHENSELIRYKYEQLYKDFDIKRATNGNLSFLGAYEAARIAGVLLKGARGNLILAGIGVVIGTAAAVWATALG